MCVEDRNEILRNIVQMRMEAKSLLEYYRGLSELSGKSYEKEINALLDKINLLNKLEKGLKE
jgi:ABC-type Na+ transport system ATPase subunit NatA